MTFKCRLKIILWEKGMKQGELAKKTGISPAGISALVNNRIAEELQLPIEEIWIRADK